MDCTLSWMREHHIPPTLSNYLSLAYMGDVENLDDVGPEDRVQIDELLATGELGVETADGKIEFRLPLDEEGE